MQAIVFIIFFAFLHSTEIGNGKAYGQSSDEIEVGNANDFMDQLLEDVLRKHGHELDPHPLPVLGANFTKTILLMTYKGKAQLHDGVLTGLCTLHRDGDCTMSKDDETGFHADVNLAMNDLKFTYKGTVSFMGAGPSINIYGSIGYLSINMIIKAEPEGEARVHKFKVRQMKGLVVKIKGLEMFNSMIKFFTDLVVKMFKPALHRLLEREVKIAVDARLKDFDLPL